MTERLPTANAESDRLTQPYESIWTRLVVDPVATPVARRLAIYHGVTPNRVTVTAGLIAIAAAACFATGLLRLGGALFILRFFVDCLDGKIARAQQTSSQRGAALDLMIDINGIILNFAALSWYLTTHDFLAVATAFGVMASVSVFAWLVAYRKHIAERAKFSDGGGAGGRLQTNIPILRYWASWCESRDMMPIPYSVEAEIVSLGLLPLTGSPALAAIGLWIVLFFYLLAAIVNARRVWRIAGWLDADEIRVPTSHSSAP